MRSPNNMYECDRVSAPGHGNRYILVYTERLLMPCPYHTGRISSGNAIACGYVGGYVGARHQQIIGSREYLCTAVPRLRSLNLSVYRSNTIA
ncbi:MAG: hypothetical protein AB4352_06525, partial [Hormoscilla sp.]